MTRLKYISLLRMEMRLTSREGAAHKTRCCKISKTTPLHKCGKHPETIVIVADATQHFQNDHPSIQQHHSLDLETDVGHC